MLAFSRASINEETLHPRVAHIHLIVRNSITRTNQSIVTKCDRRGAMLVYLFFDVKIYQVKSLIYYVMSNLPISIFVC